MTIDNAPVANEPPTRGTRGKSRNVYSWVKGIFLGAVLAVVLVGALMWMSPGLGLFHLMSILRGGPTQIHVDQPTVVRQIQQLQQEPAAREARNEFIS